MKFRSPLSTGFLILAMLTGCGEGGSGDKNGASNKALTCGRMNEQAQGQQPDQGSIENLFGCVTFTHTSSDGENTFTSFVEFSAENEGDPILRGRTVTSSSSRRTMMCAEILFGPDDFLCVQSGFNSVGRFAFGMDSQFKGSGTHQLCIGNMDDACTVLGIESPKNKAAIAITRDARLATNSTTMNNLAISDREAADYELADALQFGNTKSIATADDNAEYIELLDELRDKMQSTVAEFDSRSVSW